MRKRSRSWEHGVAQVIPGRRIHTPLDEPKTWHWLNVIPGAVPKYNVAAVRLDSARTRFTDVVNALKVIGAFSPYSSPSTPARA